MKRSTLHVVAEKRKAVPLSLVKKAIRLFRGRGIAKATYRRNALAWIKAHQSLGDKHTLLGGEVRWGMPGKPFAAQVFAPRRLRA